MRHATRLLAGLCAAVTLALAACGADGVASGDTAITGTITQASGMQVYLDRVNGPNVAVENIAKADLEADGDFALEVPGGLERGAYRLRLGAQKVPLVLDGDESSVAVTGSMADIMKYEYEVAGSESSAELQELLSGLARREKKVEDIAGFIAAADNPYAAAYAAELSIGANGKYLEYHDQAFAKLEAAEPGSRYGAAYGAYINRTRAQYAQQQASQLIKIGQPAPDIKLPSPDGKEYSLSDLKGNVVLLDFWASWCGPCRRENPNVVKAYDRFKDKGFTVYSVSLDGVDSRTAARLGGPEQAEKQRDAMKNRWVNAIERDRLAWPYHVSDLKKWESLPAQTYGVRGIPKAFLIDQEGKIVAMDLRGGALERELEKLLG